MALDPNVPPSSNFDLTSWKLGLPIDSTGGFSGTAIEIKDLAGYQHPYYFYTAADGAMTFAAPVEGATTSGSNYARSELLEMNGTARAAWTLSTGGYMAATLEVDRAPITFEGVAGRIVIGQIHGASKELVRLYWENGRMYFVNSQAGSNNVETKFYFTNATGQNPVVSLNERFSYTIHAIGDNLEVTVSADGQLYRSTTKINSVWQSDAFYLKAGAYLGVNETQGTGWGQTSFYDLRFNHNGTAIAPVTAEPVPATTYPPIGIGSTQLELLALANFTLLSLSSAEGGQAVENKVSNVEATARGSFVGEAGTYTLTLDYYDENDGASPMGIRINGSTVDSWVADKQLGSSGATYGTLTSRSVTVTLNKGDAIEVYGTRKDAELVRVDTLKVELVSTSGPTPTDYPVTAADDSYAASEDTSLTVAAAQGVLVDDTASDGGKIAQSGTFATAQGGKLLLNGDGSFTYTPKADFFGSDSFDYTVLDADGDSDVGTITFAVAGTNDPVLVTNDAYAATEDTALAVSAANGVLVNDKAPDGEKVAVAGTFATAQGGSVVLNGDGSFTYTPKADFFGSDSFNYTAKDIDGSSGTGSVTFTVADVAEPTSTRPITTNTINGNDSPNDLKGTSANDLIDGKGGDDKIWGGNGSDVLIGGPGKDAFVFDTQPSSTNVDVIVDFNPAEDAIRLSTSVFTKLKSGKLASSSFVTGEAAKDANDYIIYNNKTGALYYDADGNSSGTAMQFASIENLARLSASNITVF